MSEKPFLETNKSPARKNSFLDMVIILLTLTLMLWVISTRTHLYECGSESLQGVRYILAINRLTLKRGDIVSISGHDTAYVRGKTLAKKLIGLPGDVIEQTYKGILVSQIFNGRQQIKIPLTSTLPFLEKTIDGKVLTPITATIVPEGYVFVSGDHPRSFDSRYEEFGLVPMERIWGKAVLWW
ncbi:MAG: hypothetical protein BGO67_08505 [Alphaproteobacteria bacterium 41-28]|nr:MAG: hypothetical protein BGO67_08505 [Alphaproteobacteria bacterium 41-28]